ncbi:hypothetical protein [Pseudonocardia halophobica]
MLGPSGVGKTSMLATMYDQMESVVVREDLQLTPDPDDADELDRKIVQLQRLFATDGLKPDMAAGISGTADWRAFDFALGRRGKKPTLRLEFVDYPGGWIEDSAGSQQREWVRGLIRDSDAILIPIDTPALLERNGLWHRSRNRPDFIHNMLQLALEDLPSPRLIILAPIRCERYIRDGVSRQMLGKRVVEGYDKLLGHLSFGRLGELAAVVITPIQTVGELEYHGSPKDRYLPVFRKQQADAKYNPIDSEQPLRYVIRFALRLHGDRRDASYFRMMRQLLGSDRYLLEAANAFATGCKTDEDGFLILQGAEWLTMQP